jgi:glycosyltransferase involved in cell wall biosynthesis
MRIAVLSDRFLMGGLETRTQGIFRCQKDVHLITQFYDNTKANNFQSVTLCPMEKDSIRKALLTINPDMVDIHPFTSMIEGSQTCTELGIRYAVTIHGPYINESFVPSINNADHVFAVSPEVRDLIASLTPKNVHILRNGVDMEIYASVYTNQRGRVAIISRIDKDKEVGIRALLDVADCDVIGSGTELKILKKDYPRSRFLGYRDVPSYFAEHGGEYSVIAGMGRVILEGIALGYPVLLLGYDGIKGYVTSENFERLAYKNFSGRGEPNVEYELNPPDKRLRKLLDISHNEKKIASQYFGLIRKGI